MSYFINRNHGTSKELAVGGEGFIFLSREINWFNEKYYMVQDLLSDTTEDFDTLADAVEFFNSIVNPDEKIRIA